MEDLVSIAFSVAITTFVINMIVGTYGIFVKHNVIKKILALIIFSDSLNMLSIAIGFRIAEKYPSPPILTTEPRDPRDLTQFADISVDPLPQALVITAIVIGFSVFAFLLSLAVLYYKYNGTLDIRTSLEVEENEEGFQ
ncbi:MAG: cation:proton antiporter subunit C [Sulfolobales archaeon]|uniref:Na+/H+ antiporter subunit C n=1 Tax=Ignisphaera aggregans TaxID=334771 RepID=A0A7J3I777_9CREN